MVISGSSCLKRTRGSDLRYIHKREEEKRREEKKKRKKQVLLTYLPYIEALILSKLLRDHTHSPIPWLLLFPPPSF